MTTTLLLGPPGTGKTTSLLDAVERELDRGVAPDRIGFVTFTRRAAEEAVRRAGARFNLQRKQLPYFRTLHSLCFRQLGLSGGDVLDGDRLRRDFADYARVEVRGRWSEEDGTFNGYAEGDRLLFMEHLARVRGITLRAQYEQDNDGLGWDKVVRVSYDLARFKDEYGVLDYTDMLSEFARQNNPPRLEALFVDEAQDQSRLQWDVVHCLSREVPRLTIAGDDDQAIYRWAGADVEEMIALRAEARVLGQSYRCPREVQALAIRLLAFIRGPRRLKEWRAREGEGQVERTSSLRSVDLGGAWGEDEAQPVLILARNEYVLRERVEPELRERGIIYEHGGRVSVRPSTLDAVVSWEELRAGKSVPVSSVLRVYNLMTAGRGVERGSKELPGFDRGERAPPVTLEDLVQRGGLRTRALWHEALDRIPRAEVSYMLSALRHGEKLRARPRVRISTIHGAKGGEARHVVLFKEMANRTAREMEYNPDDELRVWYVAVTRAREHLTLVGSETRNEVPWL